MAFWLALLVLPDATRACGPLTDCSLGDRVYRIRMPDERAVPATVGRKRPAVVFLHGWRGTPDDIMRNATFSDTLAALGIALVAPKSDADSWAQPNSPSGEGPGDLAFLDRLLDVLPERHGIDPQRVVASGFSAGGMMVWNLACHRGDRYAAFVPIAGTFWSPLPSTCPSPAATLSHVHGTSDPVVPLEGRSIRDRFRQGRVADALALYARHGDFGPREPVASGVADLSCERASNAEGALLESCMHPGGHVYAAEPIVRVMRARGLIDGG